MSRRIWLHIFGGDLIIATTIALPFAKALPKLPMFDELTDLAETAASKYPNMFKCRGVKIHTAFKELIEDPRFQGLLQQKTKGEYEVRAEISYLDGFEVKPGTPGSIRIDAGVFDKSGKLIMVYDLKTGSASLSVQRIVQISKHLPKESQKVPIFEIYQTLKK